MRAYFIAKDFCYKNKVWKTIVFHKMGYLKLLIYIAPFRVGE
jgi:hypothetical protein